MEAVEKDFSIIECIVDLTMKKKKEEKKVKEKKKEKNGKEKTKNKKSG